MTTFISKEKWALWTLMLKLRLDNLLYIGRQLQLSLDDEISLAEVYLMWHSVEPNKILYYASSKLQEVTERTLIGLHINAFNTNIIEHTYQDGIGTIIFTGKVTEIGDFAFFGCTDITLIILPYHITRIGYAAFYSCYELSSINIPNTVTSIDILAFGACSSLFPLNIPKSVLSIGESAFELVNNVNYSGIASGSPWGAKYINGYILNNLVYTGGDKTILVGCNRQATGSIVIPNSVISIGDRTFALCQSITSISIPEAVTIIGEGTFNACTSLTSIELSDSIISIGSKAFAACENLTSLILGNSVIKIDDLAFSGCEKLTSLIFPESVTEIGRSAIYGCNSLSTVTSKAIIPPILGDYNMISAIEDIYVPALSVDAYKTATNWSYYADKIKSIPE